MKNDNSGLPSTQLLNRLLRLADARLGSRPTSARPAPVAQVLVGMKTGVRRAMQPFINDLFGRQTRFNEELLEWGKALSRDVESLERSMTSMRTSLDARISRLEESVARLEARQPTDDAKGAEPSRKKGRSNGHEQV